MAKRAKKVTVPFGDNLIPERRVARMLEIIEDLYPLAFLPEEEFYRGDAREEAGAYSAALGRCASKLPLDFVKEHPEIDWRALGDLQYIAFHDGIDVLILRDRLQEILPVLRKQLQKMLSAAE